MSKQALANDNLKSFIDRIERLEEEKAALAADIREVYSEAKGTGFDTKIMRKVIALRKMDAADRQEMEVLLDHYKHALGMLGDTPLGQAAVETKKATVSPAARFTRLVTPHDPKAGEIIEPNTPSEGVVKSETRVADRSDAATPPHSTPKPTMDVTNEIPSFLLRTKPPPQPVT